MVITYNTVSDAAVRAFHVSVPVAKRVAGEAAMTSVKTSVVIATTMGCCAAIAKLASRSKPVKEMKQRFEETVAAAEQRAKDTLEGEIIPPSAEAA